MAAVPFFFRRFRAGVPTRLAVASAAMSEGKIMNVKREINPLWLVFLLAATVVLIFWTISIFPLVGVILYDSNPEVAKSLTDLQRRSLNGSVQLVLRTAVIPMAALQIMWMLAYFCERREHNKLRKHLAETAVGSSPAKRVE